MTNAIIYARFSPRPTAQDCASIETQNDRCRAQCAAKDWPVIAEFADRELSGGRADNRPGLQDALNAACEHKAVIVVYSLSRLARNTQDAIAIVDRLSQCEADLFSLHETIDTTTASGRFTFTLFAALATLEREQISERTSDAMKLHQVNGRRMGRPDRLPYGWKADPENLRSIMPCEDEQKTVAAILQMRAEGLNLRDIGKRLTEHGIMCRGAKWHPATILRIIRHHTHTPAPA